jgi:hypothetical protein
VRTIEVLLEWKSSNSGLGNRDWRPWEFGTLITQHPLPVKVGTNFCDKRRSLGRYSSITGLLQMWYYSLQNKIYEVNYFCYRLKVDVRLNVVRCALRILWTSNCFRIREFKEFNDHCVLESGAYPSEVEGKHWSTLKDKVSISAEIYIGRAAGPRDELLIWANKWNSHWSRLALSVMKFHFGDPRW